MTEDQLSAVVIKLIEELGFDDATGILTGIYFGAKYPDIATAISDAADEGLGENSSIFEAVKLLKKLHDDALTEVEQS